MNSNGGKNSDRDGHDTVAIVFLGTTASAALIISETEWKLAQTAPAARQNDMACDDAEQTFVIAMGTTERL